jgi:eukaryotic-like serine/threonine-protein kinase
VNAPERIGRYTLIRKLATGGMAEVFLARVEGPAGFAKQLVVKRILPELARDAGLVEMFLREARLAATFDHPNVAHVYDFGHEGPVPFLAMEYVDGPTLRQVRKRAETRGWKLPIDVVTNVVSRACEGLHYLHELKDPQTGESMGLVHRDVSPDNIMVSRSGIVKVLDFGIAKDPRAESTTREGTVRGKLQYMSPEQIGDEVLDRRVDVWALGIVLFEMLTLRKPYLGTGDAAVMRSILFEPFTPVQQLRPDVPDALAAIVDACLEKDRNQRLGSARVLQAALESFGSSMGPNLGSYDVATFLGDLVDGRPPRGGASTLPIGPALVPGTRPAHRDLATPAESPASGAQTRPERVASAAPVVAVFDAAKTLPPTGGVQVMARDALTVNGTGASTAKVALEANQPSKTQPRASTSRTTRRSAVVALAVAMLAVVAIVALGASREPEPAPPREVPTDPRPMVAAATVSIDAGVAVVELPPQPPEAEMKTEAVDAGRSMAVVIVPPRPGRPARRTPVPLEVRVLPEGTVAFDGRPGAPTTVTPGAHTVTFSNKRFGTVSRLVTLPPCEGSFLVGYSFQSDRVTVACRNP